MKANVFEHTCCQWNVPLTKLDELVWNPVRDEWCYKDSVLCSPGIYTESLNYVIHGEPDKENLVVPPHFSPLHTKEGTKNAMQTGNAQSK